jgi:predicted DNA-binding transcriptional regulator AlpA
VAELLSLRPAPAPDTAPAPADPLAHLRDRPEAPAVEPLLAPADQAAALCAVSPATWYRMAAAGRCPAPVRLSPGCVRWRLDELREWITAGCPSRREWEARRAAANAGGRPR